MSAERNCIGKFPEENIRAAQSCYEIQVLNHRIQHITIIHEKNEFCGGVGYLGKKKLAEDLA